MPPSPYLPIAQQAAAKYGVPEPVLLRQINQESGWNPNARSSAGAMGLLQLMPATARGLGVKNPFDPGENVDAGARYLSQLHQEFGSWKLALAAYNAGPGRVRDGSWTRIPETVNYVNDILTGLPQQETGKGSAGHTAAPVGSQGVSGDLSPGALSLLMTLINGGSPSPSQLLAGLADTSGASPALPPLPSAVSFGKATNPVPNANFERVDQGVDFMSKSPVRALGPGVIESVSKGMAGGTGDIIKERLDRPVTVNGRSYGEVYYSEESPLVQAGQRVAAGQNVMAPGGNEIGFLQNGRFAPLVGGLGAGTQPTEMGADMLAFLRKLARGQA